MYLLLCGTQEVYEKGWGVYHDKVSFGLALVVLTAIDLTHPLTALAQNVLILSSKAVRKRSCTNSKS